MGCGDALQAGDAGRGRMATVRRGLATFNLFGSTLGYAHRWAPWTVAATEGARCISSYV
jgi:hypothetical protein